MSELNLGEPHGLILDAMGCGDEGSDEDYLLYKDK